MDIEALAYRLVGSLPSLAVMTVGVLLAIYHRWRNPRVCLLVGIALTLALAMIVVLPLILDLSMRLMMNQFGMDQRAWRLVSLVHSFIYSSGSAIVWGLVLFAIFGRDGIVRPPREPEDSHE